ncbi:MAG: hypothetical protein ACTSYA_08660 [Candidatus Kariarchaeaceae archaeon]
MTGSVTRDNIYSAIKEMKHAVSRRNFASALNHSQHAYELSKTIHDPFLQRKILSFVLTQAIAKGDEPVAANTYEESKDLLKKQNSFELQMACEIYERRVNLADAPLSVYKIEAASVFGDLCEITSYPTIPFISSKQIERYYQRELLDGDYIIHIINPLINSTSHLSVSVGISKIISLLEIKDQVSLSPSSET